MDTSILKLVQCILFLIYVLGDLTDTLARICVMFITYFLIQTFCTHSIFCSTGITI